MDPVTTVDGGAAFGSPRGPSEPGPPTAMVRSAPVPPPPRCGSSPARPCSAGPRGPGCASRPGTSGARTVEVVPLSRLLFQIVREARPGAAEREIAERAGGRLGVRISADQVRYVLEARLHPLGLVAGADGSAPVLRRLDPLRGLTLRFGTLPPRVVDALGGALAPLLRPLVLVPVLAVLLAFDGWLFAVHGVGGGLSAVIERPAIGLLLLALSYASLFVHECGHAAACRYGGARPGAMGAGVYFLWPALYTDLTDAYRLGRAGRLRTDLGGIYFNGLYSLGLAAVYAATGFEPLLLAVAAQHALAFQQFMPWLRLDGSYVVADAIGVPDLFSRIRRCSPGCGRAGLWTPASPSSSRGRGARSPRGSWRRSWRWRSCS